MTQLRVEEGAEIGKSRLVTIHGGKEISFLYLYFGPGTSEDIKEQIEQANLAKPTMAETSALVYAAFASKGIRSDEIKKDCMDNGNMLFAFTRPRYEPNEGCFFYPEDSHDRFKDMPVSQLEQLLGQKQEHGVVYSDDGSLRFVPFGYQINEMSCSQLAQNAFVIGLAGEEGAEKLAKVAEKYKNKPFLFSFKYVDSPLKRVTETAINSSWAVVPRLYIDCGSHGNYTREGCAFGVLKKTGADSSLKN